MENVVTVMVEWFSYGEMIKLEGLCETPLRLSDCSQSMHYLLSPQGVSVLMSVHLRE